MTEAFAFIGVAFVVFSIIAYPAVRRGGSDVVSGVFFALWVLIAFGVGSWAISWLYVHGLEAAWFLSETLHIPFLVLLASPIAIIVVVGILKRRKSDLLRRQAQTDPLDSNPSTALPKR